MNLTGRKPYQKQAKAKPDPDRLARIRGLPCIVCLTWGETQKSPTTAHHVICGRYGTRKTPDSDAIGLCDGHHQGTFDRSKLAIHRDRSAWVAQYGPDTDYIEAMRRLLNKKGTP